MLVFRHAHALAFQIFWPSDAGITPDPDSGMEKPPRSEDWQPHPIAISAGDGHHQGRHGHFGDIEFAEMQLSPENLRWMQRGGRELDTIRLDFSPEDRQ
ncbi:MAG: hypothetical protein ACRDHX_02570 [Chloroflexota bacterium]